MQPIYTPRNVHPAYQLNWGLTLFWRQAAVPDTDWLIALQKATEHDGVRVLKHRLTDAGQSQFVISTKPHVAPKDLIRSVKGRLQHELRHQVPKALQRNYCLRGIGAATREVVEEYVTSQLDHHPMVDPRVQQRLTRFQQSYPEVDLKQPQFSAHGKYWYNLHLVLVNDERWMEIREKVLETLFATIERAAAKHSHRVSRLALLPDHVHLTLGCGIGDSPEEVAIGYLNNCAYAIGMKPLYQYSYYVGTFGEYDRGAV